ncbi:helix-turn-helix domain-containing protein [Streptomyces sp. NPDC051217]|uniref:helix-turn-helix domain-containing protein n=1 Tax=Streptomyces sp. NPDC051217 TaxID=3365644 RepID=UPI0037BA448D
MAAHFNTSTLAPQEREEYIREMARRQAGTPEVNHSDEPTSIYRPLSVITLGAVSVSTIRGNSLSIRRTQNASQDNVEQTVVLTMQLSGTCVVRQNEREAVVRPGEFVIHDNSQPFVLSGTQAVEQITVSVPRNVLALPSSVLRAASARTIDPSHPTAEVAATYFRQLVHSTGPDHNREPDLLGPSCIELIRALIATTQDQRSDVAAEPPHRTLQQHVMTYLRAHLGDSDLSASRVAAEHHISVRQLYLVLSRAGISLGDWIRTQRLEESRRELVSPRGRHATIESVARRWGFASASHFSRAFKKTYGMSPRQWRLENLAA